MIENFTEGQAKDEILKYCIENNGLNPGTQIRKDLFPNTPVDIINLLIEKIGNSTDPIAEVRLNSRTKYISSNGITPIFLKQGGYAKSEQDEYDLKDKAEQKENLEEQIRELTRDNLSLQNKQMKRTVLYSVIGFIFGAIITNLKDILILLNITSPE